MQKARDKGAALLMAIVSVMVLMLISSIFFTVVINRLRTETLEEKILKSYTLAEAGINFAYYYILSDSSITYYYPDPANDPPTSLSSSDFQTLQSEAAKAAKDPQDPNQSIYAEDPNANFVINEVVLAYGHNSADTVNPNSKVLISITVKCTGTYRSVQRTLHEQYALSW